MALLFMDGCDIYGASSALLAQRYNQLHGTVDANFTPVATGGRFGEGYISMAANPARQLVKMFDSPQNDVFFGFYFRTSALPASTVGIAYIVGESGSRHFIICLTSAGTLQLRNSSVAGGQFGSTGTTVLAPNTWYFITAHFVNSIISGVADLRIDNISEITFSGNTFVFGEDAWGLVLIGGQSSPAITHSFDDIFIWNNLTGWPNTWIAPQRIDTLVPDADGQFSEAYFSTNTDLFSAVNTLGEADQNTAFITLDGPAKVTLETDNLSVTPPGNINVVNVGSFLGNTGSVVKNAKMLCRVRHVLAESSATTINITPTVLGIVSAPFFEDPHAAGAWTEGEINNHLQIGVKIERPTTIDPEGTQRFGFFSGNLPALSAQGATFTDEIDVSVFDYPFGRERAIDRVFFTPAQSAVGYSARAVIYDIDVDTGLPKTLLGVSNQTTGATLNVEMSFVFPHTIPVFPNRKYGIGLWGNSGIQTNTVGQNSLFYVSQTYASSGFPGTGTPPEIRYGPGYLVPVQAQALIPAARAPGTYRFWRIRIGHTALPATYAEFREIQFRETVGGSNSATGGQPISSNDFSASYMPWRAFDGNLSTTWASPIYTTGEQWIGYLFPASIAITQIVLFSFLDPSASPTEFFVDRSDDGVNWTQTNSFTGLTWTADEVKTFNL